MKRSILILVSILFLSCSKLPFGPEALKRPWAVIIEHSGTEYVEVDSSIQGLLSTKVNVLFFEITTKNFRPKALEFYGWATLHGPPENREHAVHFRTDSISMNPPVTGYAFHTQEWIEPGSTYTFQRLKFPTNEYSPFQGVQGMVKKVTITGVWAYNENGIRFSVVPGDTVSS